MINEFTTIGEFLLQFRAVKDNVITGRRLEEIEKEFQRISAAFLWAWSENKIGLKYYLTFHHAEGQRLISSISIEDLEIDSSNDITLEQLKCCTALNALYKGLFEVNSELQEMVSSTNINL